MWELTSMMTKKKAALCHFWVSGGNNSAANCKMCFACYSCMKKYENRKGYSILHTERTLCGSCVGEIMHLSNTHSRLFDALCKLCQCQTLCPVESDVTWCNPRILNGVHPHLYSQSILSLHAITAYLLQNYIYNYNPGLKRS